MKIAIRGKQLFFDVQGPEFVISGSQLKQLPTLILIHGAPGNSDHSVFKPAFDGLSDVCRVVYLDLSGAGRSDDPPSDVWSLDDWADDLVAFCDALEIEKPIVLGVSGGGFVAMAYGVRYPDHPGKLILASTQATLNVERSIAEFFKLGGEEASAAARDFLTVAVNVKTSAVFAEKGMTFYNTTPQPARASVVFRPKLAMAFHKLDGIWHTFDLLADLPKVSVPTLVLSGDKDPVTPLQDSLDIAAKINPDLCQLAVIDNAGHGPWRDQPGEVFSIIRAFILR